MNIKSLLTRNDFIDFRLQDILAIYFSLLNN